MSRHGGRSFRNVQAASHGSRSDRGSNNNTNNNSSNNSSQSRHSGSRH